MRYFWSFALLTALCLSGLPSEAQYLVAYKGDTVPFDTAVVTNAPTFRLESRKIALLEGSLRLQQERIWSLEGQLNLSDLQLEAERDINRHLQGELNVTQAALREMSPQLDRALEKVQKEGRFYNKNGFWLGVGAGIAILLLK